MVPGYPMFKKIIFSFLPTFTTFTTFTTFKKSGVKNVFFKKSGIKNVFLKKSGKL
jgi:hypothetical protein